MTLLPNLRRRKRKQQAVRSRGRTFLLWLLFLVLGFYSLCSLYLLYLRWGKPVFASVQIQRRVESLVQGRPYEKRSTFVPLNRIPLHFRHAVIAAEDGGFYGHSGIDWQELRKVVRENQQRRRMRGGSTITQQLVKNLFLTTHRSVLRKGMEFALAPLAELILPKDRILELYFNVIEWGPGIYGAEAASEYHYGISAAEVDREQAARLAACIPAPRARRPSRMNQYSAEILDRMSRRGW